VPTLLNQSPALLAGLAFLIAIGFPGVLVLRRFGGDVLSEFEQWIYGMPLGMVAMSLIILAAACLGGLTLPLVLVVGIASAAAIYPLSPRLRKSSKPEARISKLQARSWFATVVISAFVIRWTLFWVTGYRYDETGLRAGNTGFWADWALHIGDTASFVFTGNFPPQHMRYAGEPYAYHYLTSVTAAAMAKFGAEIPFVLLAQSLVLSLFVLFAVYLFARRLTGDSAAAALVLVLFFLGGTLGWLVTAKEIDAAHSFWGTLMGQPWDWPKQEEGNYRFLNIFFSLLQPQRSFLYGIPMGLLILTILRAAVERRGRRLFLLAGCVAGLLPFANLSTLLSLAMVTPFLFLLFPSRNWLFYFGSWVAVAVPQLWLQQNGGAGAASAIRMQIGWIAPPDPWLWFWLKNLGLFLPLLIFALVRADLFDRITRRFLFALMPLFVFANLIVFQPWDWDNTKVLLYWFLGTCLFVSALLTRAWRAGGPLARGAIVAAVLSMTLSGLLANFNQALGRERTLLLTAEELDLARRIRDVVPADSIFAVGLQHNHPVTTLTGRKAVMGYGGWLWSQGYDYAERERDLREIYALAPRAPELMNKYGVTHLVVGPWERFNFGINPEMFRPRYPPVVETTNYSVFDVRRR
jgi:hypothetical protein